MTSIKLPPLPSDLDIRGRGDFAIIKLEDMRNRDLEIAKAVLEAVARNVQSTRPWCKEIASEIRALNPK